MGRLALELEKILAACRERGVPQTTLTAITNLYKKAYREGYYDGTTDAEEALEEDARDDDLY
jgi:hypothetical protein